MSVTSKNHNWLIAKTEHKHTGEFSDRYAIPIVNVASNSPAAQIGLESGDYLVTVDETQASIVDLAELLVQTDGTIKYQFFCPKQHSLINVIATAIPLGFITEPGSIAIVEQYRKYGFTDWTGLKLLWERRQWDRLLEASELISSTDPLTRLIRLFSKDFNKSAECLFKGAALYELGDTATGIELISWFINNEMYRHESYVHAIAFYYAAKCADLNGDSDSCEHWLAQANRSNRGQFEKIKQEVSQKGHEPPSVPHHWIGKLFPDDYHLNIVGKSDKISLQATLSSMRGDEILPVCVMPSYRGNGPYNEAMLCYRSIFSYVSDRVRPMHVVLDIIEKRSDREWWYEHEEAAIACDIPIVHLHDSDRSVADSLELEFSPVLFLLDNTGKTIYEGPMSEAFDYYTALYETSTDKLTA